jgi:hypothetical protein
MHPARSINKLHFLFFETAVAFGKGVQLFQSSSSIASISSFVMSDSNLPVYFNNSAWLWRRFISSSALTMASRLVLALVCRIASRSVLSGIFTVVFMQTFSLRSESSSMGYNGNEYSDFIAHGSHLFSQSYLFNGNLDVSRNAISAFGLRQFDARKYQTKCTSLPSYLLESARSVMLWSPRHRQLKVLAHETHQ